MQLEYTNEIKKLYLDRNYSLHKIRQFFENANINITFYEIHEFLKSQNLLKKSNRKCNYSVNDNFFEVIDTPEKAQLLGFIMADGCIHTKYNMVRMCLAKKDIKYLEWVKTTLKYSGPIKEYIRKNQYESMMILEVCSYKMVHDLIQLGCGPRKSLTLNFPTKVPDILIKDFLRGYIDGDGWVSGNNKNTNVGLIATPAFCKKAQEIIKNQINLEARINEFTDRPLWHLSISKQIEFLKFCEWIYSDKTYQMHRKYETYLRLKNLISNKNKRVFIIEDRGGVLATLKIPTVAKFLQVNPATVRLFLKNGYSENRIGPPRKIKYNLFEIKIPLLSDFYEKLKTNKNELLYLDTDTYKRFVSIENKLII